jgi:hypothetical protein
MEDAVYKIKIYDSNAPLITEYRMNMSVAVVSDNLLIAALTPITNANSAIISPQKRI